MFKAMQVMVLVGALAGTQLAVAAGCDAADLTFNPLTGLVECVESVPAGIEGLLSGLRGAVGGALGTVGKAAGGLGGALGGALGGGLGGGAGAGAGAGQ